MVQSGCCELEDLVFGRQSFLMEYAALAADDVGWTIAGQSFAVNGATISQIQGEMGSHLSALRNADLVVVEAGGNDLIIARDQFKAASCDTSLLDAAELQIKSDWISMLNFVDSNKKQGAIVRIMNLYLGQVREDRSALCPDGNSAFETFFPYFMKFIDHVKTTAEDKEGFLVADSLSVMNCNDQAGGGDDPNCLLDPSNIQDPRDTLWWDGTALQTGGLVQADAVHMDEVGNALVGEQFHLLGYVSYPCIHGGEEVLGGCVTSTNCCSGRGSCTGGKPSTRQCTASGEEPTSPPGDCFGNKVVCTAPEDCCSGKCVGGACKGNRLY